MVGLSSGCSSFPNAVLDGKLTDGPRQKWLRRPGGEQPCPYPKELKIEEDRAVSDVITEVLRGGDDGEKVS
jgi:hypothetical protein